MPIYVRKGGMTVTGEDGMRLYRMLALRSALSLEMRGLRSRLGSAYAIIKREFGLKGSREKVLEQFTALCDEASASVERINEETE